jgi:hypothetical protein
MPRGIYKRTQQKEPIAEAEAIDHAAMEYQRAYHAARKATEHANVLHSKAEDLRYRLLEIIHGEHRPDEQGNEVDR